MPLQCEFPSCTSQSLGWRGIERGGEKDEGLLIGGGVACDQPMNPLPSNTLTVKKSLDGIIWIYVIAWKPDDCGDFLIF